MFLSASSFSIRTHLFTHNGTNAVAVREIYNNLGVMFLSELSQRTLSYLHLPFNAWIWRLDGDQAVLLSHLLDSAPQVTTLGKLEINVGHDAEDEYVLAMK